MVQYVKEAPTRGGRHSSACRLSTEKPPCVLVSDAVKVLQKECTWNLGGGGGGDSFSIAFSSCCYKKKKISFLNNMINLLYSALTKIEYRNYNLQQAPEEE